MIDNIFKTGKGEKADAQLSAIKDHLESQGFRLGEGQVGFIPNWLIYKDGQEYGQLFCYQGGWPIEGDILTEHFGGDGDRWEAELYDNEVIEEEWYA